MIWRRLRGILGVALLWAVAWLPLGLLLGLYTYWREGPMDFDAPWPPGHFFSQSAGFLRSGPQPGPSAAPFSP
jgi:hypothetical protein